MSARTLQEFPRQQPLDFDKKPRYGFQQYLIQMKVSTVLLRELLVEVKELVVLLGLISFFVWGMVELFLRLDR